MSKSRQGDCPICKTSNVTLMPVEGNEGTYYICGDCIYNTIDPKTGKRITQ